MLKNLKHRKNKYPSYLPKQKGIIEVPMDLLNDFLLNPTKAMRDFASIPTEAISQFYGDVESLIPNIFTSSLNNILDSQKFRLREVPVMPEDDIFRRYVHVDISIKKDAAGFAMCHVPKYVEIERFDDKSKQFTILKLPYIKFDFAGRILAPSGGEIEIANFRDILETLRDNHGYEIALVTFDRYQSSDSLQILRSLGFTVGHLSIDRTAFVLQVNYDKKDFIERITTDKNYATPHEMLRVLIGDGRVEIPRVYPRLDTVLDEEREWSEDRELKSQEYDSIQNKVSKSFHGTDDWVQAIAGAVCNAVTNELDIFYDSNVNIENVDDNFNPYNKDPDDDPYEFYNTGVENESKNFTKKDK